MQAAVDAVTREAGISRGVIALSRPLATPLARAQLRGESDWTLEDGEDLSRAVRALPADQRLQLVDSYFPGYRSGFLGIEIPSPWLSESENETLLSGRAGYERDFDLVGRDAELAALQGYVAGTESIVLVTGGGGSGKTRLFTELARREVGRSVVFASRALISPDALELLPEFPVVVVDDTGDREGDVAALVAGILRVRSSAQVLLGFRPHHEDRIRRALKDLLWSDLPRVDLRPLSLAAAKTLAADALGTGADAQAIAALGRNGRDCPLLIVIGAHLIRDGRLDPSNVTTSRDLRSEVLSLYAASLIGPDDSRARTKLLDVVAAVQPVRMDDPHFIQVISVLLKLEDYEVPRAIDELEHAGLLTRRGESVRIVPDLLGDALLQRALVAGTGRATGFSDRLAAVAGGAPLRNALHNVAVAEWVARNDTQNVDLSGALWDAINRNALASTGSERIDLAHDIEAVAGARPESALRLARTIIENPAAPEESPWAKLFEGDLTIGPAKVEQSFTRLIANSARIDLLPEAMTLLWRIGHHDPRPQNQHPDHGLRLLAELGSFDIGKPFSVTDRYVRTIGQWLGDETLEPSDRAKLLKLLTPAIERDGHSESSDGLTLTLRQFSVPIEEVAPIRSAVLDIASTHLCGDAIVASEALALLEHSLRNAGPDLDPEFERVATLISEVIADPSVAAGIRLTAFRTLGWHAAYGEGATQQRAREVRRNLNQDLDIRLTRLLRSGWAIDDDDDADDEAERFTLAAGERRVVQTATDMLTAYPDDDRLLDVLLSAIRAELAEQEQFVLPGYFIAVLCDERATFAASIVRRALLESATDVTWQSLVRPALAHLLDVDVQHGLASAESLLTIERTWSRVIAGAISSRRNAAYSRDEAALVRRLLKPNDEVTELELLSGNRWFDESSARLAEEVLRIVAIDQYPTVAKAACNLLAYGPTNVTWELLSDVAKEDILRRLEQTPDISDYAVQSLLARAAIGRERQVLRLLQSRVDRATERSKGYTPIPYHWYESPNFRTSTHYPAMMRDLVTWITELPSGIGGWWAPKLFALAAGPYDDEIQQLALSLTREGSVASVRAAGKILEEAPQEYGMQHPTFVAQILDAASALGTDSEQRIGAALYSATMYGMRSRSVGKPDAADVNRATLSREIARSFPEGSPARRFYMAIASASERNIERSIQDDEDLEDLRRW
ncbi:ATP-binding protein [Cryobacterium sp. MDB2-33-2]|uniref:ATP-binding protein n=1 Tax=Cryobacterium sp. MDB2-33-2 TaxID=1259179 RepID=UPI001F53F963|nr:ATP-binding protein [Cryobacterium sp. MDB2-33-2]